MLKTNSASAKVLIPFESDLTKEGKFVPIIDIYPPSTFLERDFYLGGSGLIEDSINVSSNIQKSVFLDVSLEESFYAPGLFVIEQGEIKDNESKMYKEIRRATYEAEEAYKNLLKLNLDVDLENFPYQTFYYKDSTSRKKAIFEYNKIVIEYNSAMEKLYKED